jgi:peptidoglycan/LPS O-acetylase OafA/YrhL/lysophospholipase L1-like esterase
MNVNLHPAVAETKAPQFSGGNSTALDQWRGLALVCVLVSHGFYFTNRVYGIGRVGVNLFFFISGVLVFRSLTSLRAATAWELTLQFWKRRARRLYPALVAYVVAMIPIEYVFRSMPGAISPTMTNYWHGAPFVLLYTIDFWPPNTTTAASLNHLWSLACEMQFYLLGPIIFLLGGKTQARRKFVWGALLVMLVASGFIGALLDPREQYKYQFEIAVWPMMLGYCCEYRKDLFQRVPAKWFRWIIVTGLIAFGAITLLMLCGLKMKKPVIAIGTFAFVPCFLAYIGNRTLGGPIGRAMTWLGERTYSIYLWQQLFTICNYLPTMLHPVGAIAAAFVGGAWFRWFERPFLSAKRQNVVVAPKSPRTRRCLWIVGLALALALVVSVILALIARRQYAETLTAKVWPTSQFIVPKLNISNSEPKSILLLGDSRIADWSCPAIEGRPVVNAGFRGITSAQLAMACREILPQTRPQVIVIQVGINDLKLLGVRPDLGDAVTSNCVSNILTIVTECRRTGARVVVTPVWPVGKVTLARRLVWSAAVDPAVAETNARLLRLLANEDGVYVVDLFLELTRGLSKENRERLYCDTLHLKPETYARLSVLLAEIVKARMGDSEGTARPDAVNLSPGP